MSAAAHERASSDSLQAEHEASMRSLLKNTGNDFKHAWHNATSQGSRAERIARFVDAAATSAETVNPHVATCLHACRPLVELALRALAFLVPFYLALYRLFYAVARRMPANALRMAFGVALCFFGGHFFASLAAIEAFRMFGWDGVRDNLLIVYEQSQLVSDASKKDDEVDADGDGIADVDQISGGDLLKRKTTLAMVTITEPEKLQVATASLWTAYVSVLATLRLQFARTTALALAIVETCNFTILRILLAPVMALLGPELKHWAKTIIEVTVNLIAVIVAWYAQTVISSFYSAIRGGRMFADGLFQVLIERDLFNRLPCYKETPFSTESSHLDELVGYALAACGFFTQFVTMYQLVFPFNLVFLPLDIVEYFLRWQIYFTQNTLPIA